MRPDHRTGDPVLLLTVCSARTFRFGGTSLIIIVGVVLDTIKKIESQMLVRNYTGFLNNKGSNASNSFLWILNNNV